MTVKESLLTLLVNNQGAYLSGESIAEKLLVSRAAIWKTIKSLRTDGYIIDAVTNKGYAFAIENDILSEVGIKRYLKNKNSFKVKLYDIVTSTNAIVNEHVHEAEGLVVVAKEQTNGIGRMGRKFFSPKDSGVYFSVLLKPNHLDSQVVFVTTMAAVAVCRAVKIVLDKSPQIKWVNDIYLNGRKICGILTQASFNLENNTADHVILGVGLNVYPPKIGFPKELSDIAGAVFETPQGDLKNRLLAEVLNCFWELYKNPNRDEIAKEYKSYSFVIGKEVTVLAPTQQLRATVLDIDQNCNLVVRYKNGEEAVLSSGEISIASFKEI